MHCLRFRPGAPPWRRLLPVLAVAAVLVAAAGGCGVAEASAASVNGREVDRSEFERELRALRGNPDLQRSGGVDLLGTGQRTVKSTISAGWLNTVLQDLVVTAEFERRDLSLSAEDRRSGDRELEALFRSSAVVKAFPDWFVKRVSERYARAVAVRNAIADVDLSDKGLEAYYEANQDQFARVCAAHILVETEEEAKGIQDRLAAGEDFAAIAKASSLDQASAANGGDLGTCAARGELVPEFEQVAFEIAVGEVSDPVQTQFGYHLIKVSDRPVLPFADVKDQVGPLAAAAGSKAFGDFLSKALSTSDVSIDPRYGELVLQPGQVPQVRPREVPEPARGRPSHSEEPAVKDQAPGTGTPPGG